MRSQPTINRGVVCLVSGIPNSVNIQATRSDIGSRIVQTSYI